MQQYETGWRDHLAVLRRRRGTLLLGFGLIAGLSMLIAYVLPCRYLSTATLLVHAPRDRYVVPSANPGDAGQQVRTLLQKNLTNPVILNIIETLHLYPGQPQRTVQERIEIFRKTLEIQRLKSELQPSGDAEENEIPFTLSFRHEQPALARQTVQVLVERLIAGNDAERNEQARQTVELLQSQTDQWQASIHAIENRISQFRLQHDGSLPEQRADNLATLTHLRDELRELQTMAAKRQENREPEPTQPGREVPSRLRLEQEYQILSSRYLPAHPDIKRIRLQMESLGFDEDPARKPRGQVGRFGGENSANGSRRRQIQEALTILERKIALIPLVEKDYGQLIRERDTLSAQYVRLKEKLTDALLLLNLGAQPHGHTVTLLEPPDLPARPDYSLKRKIILAGLFLGLLGGIGIVLLQDSLYPRVHGQNGLIRATGITPLVVIPYLETPLEQDGRQRRERHHRLSLALVLIGMVLLLATMIPWPLPETGFVMGSNFTFAPGVPSHDTEIPVSGPTH